MTHAARLAAGLCFALAATLAQGHEFKLGSITIGHPYARATVAGQPTGAGYLKLVNQGPADRLLAATTPAAAEVQLHSMSMQGDVMRMRQIDAIELPAAQTVELKPGGLHLMLTGLKAPLAAGDRIPLTLRFEKAGEVVVTVNVEALGADAAAGRASGHAH